MPFPSSPADERVCRLCLWGLVEPGPRRAAWPPRLLQLQSRGLRAWGRSASLGSIPDRVFSLLPLRGAPRLQPAGEHSAPSLSTCPRVLPPPGPQTGGTDESPPSAASNTCLWFSFSCLHVESCLFLSTWSTQVFQNLGLAVANVKRWACFSREALHLRVDMGPCLLCFSVCVPCL